MFVCFFYFYSGDIFILRIRMFFAHIYIKYWIFNLFLLFISISNLDEQSIGT